MVTHTRRRARSLAGRRPQADGRDRLRRLQLLQHSAAAASVRPEIPDHRSCPRSASWASTAIRKH